MFGLRLIIILAVVGGLIAFIGDKLGSKIGKKKLSVFGLRPYYTSVLMTVITGVLIAATTIIVMAISSDSARTAMFGMERFAGRIEQPEQGKGHSGGRNGISPPLPLLTATRKYRILTEKLRLLMPKSTSPE